LFSGLEGVKTVSVTDLDWLGLPERDPPVHPLEALRRRIESKAQETADRLGPNTLRDLKDVLKRKYGNLVRAFRLGLDIDGNGVLTYNEFAVACRAFGFEGSLRNLWDQLDVYADGQVCLHEIDANAAELLDSFKKHVFARFETAPLAWKAMDRQGLKFLTADSFGKSCKSIGWRGNFRKCHAMLDSDPTMNTRGKIHLKDIEWIRTFHTGLPDDAYNDETEFETSGPDDTSS
jgi:hypothetical protein